MELHEMTCVELFSSKFLIGQQHSPLFTYLPNALNKNCPGLHLAAKIFLSMEQIILVFIEQIPYSNGCIYERFFAVIFKPL